jgi:hypothetical protein
VSSEEGEVSYVGEGKGDMEDGQICREEALFENAEAKQGRSV